MDTELTTNITNTEIEVVTTENEISVVDSNTLLEPEVTTIDLTSNTETTEIQVVSNEVIIELTTQQGPAGIAESEMAFAQRVDFIGDNLIYRAEADPGTLDSSGSWRIRRLTIDPNSDDDITTEWADGVATFTKIWDDRLTYTYI